MVATGRRHFRALAAGPSARGGTIGVLCRNIRTLYNFEPPATDEEVQAAALQYVRKISGFTKPSQVNAEAFERACDEVAAVSARLLGELVTQAPPKDREVEAARARERAAPALRRLAAAPPPAGCPAAAAPSAALRRGT